MAFAAQGAVERLYEILTAPEGLITSTGNLAAAAGIQIPQFHEEQVIDRHAPAELNERPERVRYPVIYVYCDRLDNQLREKFRRFSGTARMVVEIRVGADRLEKLQSLVHLYTESVLDTLERRRGDWGGGLYFGGGYEVTFGPVKHGGPNFLQTAKVVCELILTRE
jgi:hypothetical protein